MSKPLTYNYTGTKGHIAALTSGLPSTPASLLSNGWEDISDPRAAAAGYQTIREIRTGLRLRFDSGVPDQSGFRGQNHYHILNPNTTSNKDLYLDRYGNPVRKNSKASHILPLGGND